MPGFMEGYGAADEKRGKWIKRILLIGLPVLILGTAGFFYFRTWSQERVVSSFRQTVEKKDFETAYRMWCTSERPCRYYPMEKFLEDWGESGLYPKMADLKIQNVDYCDSGVVFETNYPNAKPFGLWVDRSTNLITFSAWQRCPGRHLQIGQFFKRIFG